MAEGTEQVGGIGLGLVLDTAGFSAGIGRAKAELAGLESRPVHIIADVAVKKRDLGLAVTPTLSIGRKDVAGFRAEIDSHMQAMGASGAVRVPIKLDKINYAALRAEIAAGIGSVPIRIAIEGGKGSALNLVAATVAESSGRDLPASTAFVKNAARKSGITPRRYGGPVMPGKTYMVGENGPELAQFGGQAYVRPMSSGGPLFRATSGNAFADAIRAAAGVRKSNNRMVGETIHQYTPAEYAAMRTFLSRDRQAGYGIEDDGDLVSLFNAGRRGMGTSAVRSAVQRGATKLDAFDESGRLPDLYRKFGFRETGRDPWDDQYAPEGWTGGRPDVVYMARGLHRQRRLRGGPVDALRAASRSYTRGRGMPDPIEGRYLPLDADFSRRTASAYEAMPLEGDRASQRAYAAFRDETNAQYDHLRRAGFHFTPSRTDPYEPTADRTKMQLARQDVVGNRNLNVFAGALAQGHVMSPTDVWRFRGVHDLMGHLTEGYGIGPRGEYNAAAQHAQMYSPLAQKAMLTSTHGQNSVVNFSDTIRAGQTRSIADINRDAPGSLYAEQSSHVLPEEILREFYQRAGIGRARGGWASIAPLGREGIDSLEGRVEGNKWVQTRNYNKPEWGEALDPEYLTKYRGDPHDRGPGSGHVYTEPMDPWMYHVTTAGNMESILQQGVVPKRGYMTSGAGNPRGTYWSRYPSGGWAGLAPAVALATRLSNIRDPQSDPVGELRSSYGVKPGELHFLGADKRLHPLIKRALGGPALRSMANQGMTMADFMANASPEDHDFLDNLRSAHRRLRPHHIKGGEEWYGTAGQFGREQARKYGVSERTGVGILAALSAGTEWGANKTKYIKILQAHAAGLPFPYEQQSGQMGIFDGGGVREPRWIQRMHEQGLPTKDYTKGTYIVGERGPELFVPRRLEHQIPPRVMDRLPKREKGGIVEIGQKPYSLFQPPEDGWIIPNHLKDQMPHAAGGARVEGYSFDPSGSVREIGGSGRFVDASRIGGRDETAYERALNPLADRVGVAIGSGVRRAVDALRGRGGPGVAPVGAFAASAAPAPAPLVPAAPPPVGAPPPPGPSAPLGAYVPPSSRTRSSAEIQRILEGGPQLIQGRSSVRSAFAGVSSYLLGGRQASEETRREAHIDIRDLSAMESQRELVRRRVAVTGPKAEEAQRMFDSARLRSERPGATPGRDGIPTVKALERLGNSADMLHAKHLRLVTSEADLTKQIDAQAAKAEKSAIKAAVRPANVLQNIASIGLATTGYGLLTQGISGAISAVMPQVEKYLDAQMGFAATSTHVTSALADQTKALHGNAQAAVASAAAEAGLSAHAYSFVDDRLRATASIKAGAQAQGQTSDLFRATIGTGTGAPQGLYGGFGGILGSPLLGEFLGGGKGYTEQVAGDVGQLSSRTKVATKSPADPLFDLLNIFSGAAGSGGTADRGSGDAESARKASETLDVYLTDQNDSASRGANYLRSSTASLALVKSDSKVAADAMAAIGSAAGDGANAAQLAGSGIVLVDKATGQVVDSIQKYRQYWEEASSGKSIADPATVIAQQMRQLTATFAGIDASAQHALTVTGPAQTAFGLIQRPLIEPGAGIVPTGGLGATGAGAGAQGQAGSYLALSRVSQADITKEQNAGLDAARAQVAQFSPDQLGQFNSELSKAQAYSGEIKLITEQISLAQANLSAKQFSNQMFYLNRQLSDAKGLAGQTTGPGNLGALQRQSFMVGRQQTSLSLGLQQREITTNLALAQFQAPGESPEERYARKQEAEIKAKIAQRQLNLSKQQFGIEGSIFNVSAARGVGDAGRAIGMAQSERDTALQVAAGGKAIADAEQAVAIHLGKAATIFDASNQKFDTELSTITAYMAAYGGTMKEATAALKGAFAELSDSKTGLGAAVKTFVSQFTTGITSLFTGGGQPAAGPMPYGTPPAQTHASGIVGMAMGPTHAYIGEAGNEAVAILRNPRTMSLGGSGGGATKIEINVTGNTFTSEDDEDRLVQKITREVEGVISRKGQLLASRGPSY